MEARRITIIESRNNKKSVINSTAETLGELKRDLNEAGINYDGMTFYEGLTKTELKEDAAILPHDVKRMNPQTNEPETTNELAFMLTAAQKNIKSGAMSRAEAYAAIKANGLQDACVKKYGKNFTQCSTNDLIALIEKNNKPAKTAKPAEKVAETKEAPAAPAPEVGNNPCNCGEGNLREAVVELVKVLGKSHDLSSVCAILGIESTTSSVAAPQKPQSPYSDSELDRMFSGRR